MPKVPCHAACAAYRHVCSCVFLLFQPWHSTHATYIYTGMPMHGSQHYFSHTEGSCLLFDEDRMEMRRDEMKRERR